MEEDTAYLLSLRVKPGYPDETPSCNFPYWKPLPDCHPETIPPNVDYPPHKREKTLFYRQSGSRPPRRPKPYSASSCGRTPASPHRDWKTTQDSTVTTPDPDPTTRTYSHQR